MNDKEKIVWDSMISTMVIGKVIPIKIIDYDQFLNENKYEIFFFVNYINTSIFCMQH